MFVFWSLGFGVWVWVWVWVLVIGGRAGVGGLGDSPKGVLAGSWGGFRGFSIVAWGWEYKEGGTN